MAPELVGRHAESERLAALLARAAEGEGAVALLSGEAGVGKTRLMAALAQQAGDTLVLCTTTTQGRTAPYGPLVAILRGYLRASPGGLDDCGPLRGHLARILPELGEPAADTDRATLFEAIRCALERLGPALIVLDDLQWSDEATLEVLAALATPLAELPLLVVAAYRSDGLPRGHGVRRLRNDLRRAGRLEEIALAPLSRDETARLLEQRLGEAPAPALAQAVHDRTEGIPFFAEELAAALRVSGALRPGGDGIGLGADGDVPLPDTVRDAVLIGFAELPDACRQAAEVAAVAGERFDLGVVARLASDDGLSRLLDTALVHEQDGMGAFRHALAREAIYLDLPWMTRRALHRGLAEELARRGAASRDVAPHWLCAHEEEQARAALLDAAAESEALHAYRDAADAGRRALELWPEGRDSAGRLVALERHARCSQLAGELAEAAWAWRETLAVAGDDAAVARAQRSLAAVHELRGDREAATAARLAAAAAFTATGAHAEAAVEHIAIANQRRLAARHGEAIELAARARAEADRAGRLDLRVRAMGIEGMAQAKHGDYRVGPGHRPLRPGPGTRARSDGGRGRALPAPQRDPLRVRGLPARRGGARHRARALPYERRRLRPRRLCLLPRVRPARARRVVARDGDLPHDDRRGRLRLRGRGAARRDPRGPGPVRLRPPAAHPGTRARHARRALQHDDRHDRRAGAGRGGGG